MIDVSISFKLLYMQEQMGDLSKQMGNVQKNQKKMLEIYNI